jgi:hypothetical protein
LREALIRYSAGRVATRPAGEDLGVLQAEVTGALAHSGRLVPGGFRLEWIRPV